VNLAGFDTSTGATAACVLRSDGEAFELEATFDDLFSPPAHAEELMPALARLLHEAGLGWDDLDAIAVGVGPGTFTGLRIGVTTARALAGARGLELRPVSSLAALAEGIGGPLRLPLIDARRGEVFAALHAGTETVWEPFVAAPEQVAERLRAEGLAPRAAGDGSVRFRGVFEATGAQVAPDGSGSHSIRALHVCRLAQAVAPQPPGAVLPFYLRQPDAKPAQ
jgi:tRNA threonylcarbamoyladenosine biosynthesis protein TsaB